MPSPADTFESLSSRLDHETALTRRRLLQICLAPVAISGLALPSLALSAANAPANASANAATDFYSNFKGTKLVDQDGRPATPARLYQHLVLINFVYTGCSTACPVQTRALAEMQRQMPAGLRQRVQLLSLSLDPLSDTPQALRAFATRMGADLKNWTFATGRPEDVERLSEALRLFRPGTDARKLEDHSTALWLIDGRGQLRMRYSGNPPDVPRLLREIAALDGLTEASRKSAQPSS